MMVAEDSEQSNACYKSEFHHITKRSEGDEMSLNGEQPIFAKISMVMEIEIETEHYMEE
jgi:hypothetical protein